MDDDDDQEEESYDSQIEIGEAQIVAEAGLEDDVVVKDIVPESNEPNVKVVEGQEDQEESKVE